MAKPDYSTEIARLEAIVNSGTTSVSTDGLTTMFSLEQAKQRLAELKRLQGDPGAKRKISRLDILRHAW